MSFKGAQYRSAQGYNVQSIGENEIREDSRGDPSKANNDRKRSAQGRVREDILFKITMHPHSIRRWWRARR